LHIFAENAGCHDDGRNVFGIKQVKHPDFLRRFLSIHFVHPDIHKKRFYQGSS